MNHRTILLGSLLLLAASAGHSQSAGSVISAIRDRYNDIAEKARLCESDADQGEFGPLFLNRLRVNSRDHQWRAVGIFAQEFRLFYKQVDGSERRLYPDQLVFIKADRKVSARSYYEEFLYSDAGVLMFYFQKAENDGDMPAERRMYFVGPKLLRVTEDGETRNSPTARDLSNAKLVIAQSAKLADLFLRSTKL